MKRYTINLVHEGDAWLVSVPAMPNVHTWGRTMAEAQANAQEAIELYLSVLRDEGTPYPDDPAVMTIVVEVAA